MHWFLRKNRIITLFLLIALLVPLMAEGQAVTCPSTPCPPGKICIKNPICADNFWELLDALINAVFVLAIAVAPIMFIVAGFYFIGAAGDPEKITTAKKMVLYTLIGLLIVFCAKGLVVLLIKALAPGVILPNHVVPQP